MVVIVASEDHLLHSQTLMGGIEKSWSLPRGRAQVRGRTGQVTTSTGAGSAKEHQVKLWEVPAGVLGGEEWHSKSVLGL